MYLALGYVQPNYCDLFRYRGSQGSVGFSKRLLGKAGRRCFITVQRGNHDGVDIVCLCDEEHNLGFRCRLGSDFRKPSGQVRFERA